MEKSELVDILNHALKPIGFKKKGNYWIMNGEEINKGVNLQRSSFSKKYYINYGFIVNSIPLNGLMYHAYNRLWTEDNLIERDLLNLENELDDEYRKKHLEEVVLEQLVNKMQSINSEEDVLNYIKTLPTLNIIPLTVKRYFNLA
jgi:hypothetical protein